MVVNLGQQYNAGEVLLSINATNNTTNGTCFRLIYSGRQDCWTYQAGSHRRKVAQDFSSTVFALIFLARRIQPFLYLVDREVEFCVVTI